MKRVLKIVGIFVVVVIVAAIGGFLYINTSDIPYYPVEKIEFEAVSSPQSLARGRKLAMMLCVNCHRDPETGKLTGSKMLDVPAEFGDIYTPNITQDKQYGIGDWTDGEIVYLLRTGVKKDGQYAPPYMAKLPNMADEDINAIVSFLRSDDPIVQADPTPDRASKPSFLTKFLSRVAFKPFPMPAQPIELPDSSDVIALGKYLAHNLDCYACHSADFKTNDYLNPELSAGYFAGGNKPLNLAGQVMITPNLTPDEETGIGKWSEEDFIKAVKQGIIEGENALQYPMIPYVYLTDAEASAIFQYLKTIEPVKRLVERSVY